MRPYTKRMSPPFTMIGSSVAEVEETRNPNFKKGQTIVILAGWVERGIVNPDDKCAWLKSIGYGEAFNYK